MAIRKKSMYLIFHKGRFIGRTKSKRSAKNICKNLFTKDCTFKLTKVI